MIREDKHYLSPLNLKAIEKGIAKLDVFHLRIDRQQFTEEEKENNRKLYDSVSREEWSKHCEENRKRTAAKIEPLLDKLNEKFMIYQYKDKSISYSKDNWDLFFWCNSIGGERDYSYVTLGTNKKRTVEERIEDIEKVLAYIKEVGFEGIDVVVQYTVTYDEEIVKKIATEYINKVPKNKFINCFGYEGKIKEVGKDNSGNTCYGFFKKGSKRKYYKLSEMTLMEMAITA